MSLIEKLLVLSGTLWLSAIAFIVYTWIVQTRQQVVLRYIARALMQINRRLADRAPVDRSQPVSASPVPTAPASAVAGSAFVTPPPPETTMSIDKNEPLSKYENVALPDEININFR